MARGGGGGGGGQASVWDQYRITSLALSAVVSLIVAVAGGFVTMRVTDAEIRNAQQVARDTYLRNARLEAYSSLYANLGRYEMASIGLLSSYGIQEGGVISPEGTKEAPEEVKAEYRDAMNSLSASFVKVKLVGSDNVRAQADKLSEIFYETTTYVVQILRYHVDKDPLIDIKQWDEHMATLAQENSIDTTEFLKSVQEELDG